MTNSPQQVVAGPAPHAPQDPRWEPGKGFVHLHLHSEYSLLDGGNRLDRLVKRVRHLDMPAVGVTDHGNIFGAATFYHLAREHGIKPILGVEAYVTPPGKPRTDRTYSGGGEGGYHLVLLAENNTGWQNLLLLCSEAYLTGFYYKPRIDRELLATHSQGLIAINGHLGSEIGDHLLAFERTGDEKYWALAKESAQWHAAAFGSGAKTNAESRMPDAAPRFFIELQHHIPEQNSINKWLIRLARELNLPLIADNDAHFLSKEDHDAHDTLICISTGKAKSDPDRMRYPPDLYVKSPQEMRALFQQYNASSGNPDAAAFGEAGTEALNNTLSIAQRCNVELPLGKNNAPAVRVVRKGIRDSASGIRGQAPSAARSRLGTNAEPPAPGASSADTWSDLPRWDDPRYAGDLTAWYHDYCDQFDVVPLRIPDDATDEQRTALLASAKTECDAALRRLAEAGFIWRYGPDAARHSAFAIGHSPSAPDNAPNAESRMPNAAAAPGDHAEKLARLQRELTILADKGISAYFLIVWDFVNWGRSHGVPGLARGSGVGTMVGYTLGLSNACPVKYGLLFERFTDPDRTEYPDVDIDLCQDGRQRVIDHVRTKYGHVAQIITFGTLKARAAIRDAGRVMEMTPAEVDQIAKLVPEQLNITIEEALDKEPDLKKLYEQDHRVARVIDSAKVLEGQVRHAGVHAAGVIVATTPLHEIVPLYRQSGSEAHEIVTQWDGPTCEKFGLLKMDFLGLRTISVIERCKKLIREGLAEQDIWAAVGRLDEYRKWQSGPVAQCQSGEHDGQQAADQDVPGSDRLAAKHGTRNRLPDRNVAADDQGVGPRAGAAGRSGSPAQRPDPQAGSEEHQRSRGAAAQGLDHSATPPLLHSATLPLRHSATSSPIARPPHPLDLDRLSFDDPNVFTLFARGETTGVFQFESPGMRRLLTEMKPDRLEDLIAANALFRPGPMDLIPDYNRRKHGSEPVPSVHPIVDRFTSETYGVMVYQEQVMQIVHGLGGIKLRDAYTLIKNISKKKHDKIEKERPRFVDGAQNQGLTRKQAEDLFELILKFAGYGFNKSHSTGYAIVAYQTAYLKTYFPNQYMAAFLTYESQAQKAADWIPYLEDCKKTRFIDPATGATVKIGVEVRPPDINLSQAEFAVVFDEHTHPPSGIGHSPSGIGHSTGAKSAPTNAESRMPNAPLRAHAGHVRFGLKGIKGAGDKAIDAILKERHAGAPAGTHEGHDNAPTNPESRTPNASAPSVPFSSLFDFTERVAARAPGVLNKATVESLILSGALDALHGRARRAAMIATIEQALSAGAKAAADKASGQGALFGFKAPLPAEKTPDVTLASTTPWSESETLAREKAVMGFYVSSHPIDAWRAWAACFATAAVGGLANAVQDQRVIVPGLIQSIRTMIVKQGKSAGQKMAALHLEDTAGAVECVIFSDAYAKFAHLIEVDRLVFALGRIDLSRGNPQIITERLVPIDGVPLLPGRLRVIVPGLRLNGSGLDAIERVASLLVAASTGAITIPKALAHTLPVAADATTPPNPRLNTDPATPIPVSGVITGDRATVEPAFPVELVIETPAGRALLAADPRLKIRLTPRLINDLATTLGPASARIVAGVTAEAGEPNRKPWPKRGN